MKPSPQPPPDPRAEFAARELAERAADAAPPLGAATAPGTSAPPLEEPRDPQADGMDAAALVRAGSLVLVLLTTRNRTPSVERASRLQARRQRADSRATRLGQRIGMRLGRWIGDYLLAVGLIAELVTEGLDDALDEVHAELSAPDAKPAAASSVPGVGGLS